MSIADAVAQQGIQNDAAYAGCIARDFANPEYASYSPVVALCMAPYLSMFAHESYRKLETADPALATLLSAEVQAIVARSRHSLKLFEDTHRGITGQRDYFRNQIIPEHRAYFIDRVWFPPARRWAKDLGLFSYDKKVIATSHSATFHMGIGARAQLSMKGGEMRGVYEQYGRYFRHLGARLDATDPTFMSSIDPHRFNQTIDDVRTEDYYPRVFNGATTPDLNAVLTVFRGMMSFVHSVVPAGSATDAASYTVFKIRFLTLYQVLGSLRLLRDEQRSSLTNHSVTCIDTATGTPQAQLILQRSARSFRNTLMHYNLDSRVDTTRVRLDQPLFGLVPIYFPSYDAGTFAEMVDRCIGDTMAAIEEWAAL